MPDLTAIPLWANLLVFAAAAAGVWGAGAALTVYADTIADRTALGQAMTGMLVLGIATSLPEIATTGAAASSGNAALAGNNLLGGIAMQIAVLALVDAFALRGRALTFFSPRPAVLMQGVMLILMTALATTALAVGDVAPIAHVGVWPILIVAIYLLCVRALFIHEGAPRWEPAGELAQPPQSAVDMKDTHRHRLEGVTLRAVLLRLGASALAVLACGYLVAETGAALAEQTGLGAGFIGATLVALATSLPEISTTFTAVRIGAYSMAISNILGTNAIEVALFLPADVLYTQGPIFSVLDRSSILLAALGIITTAVYLWGILERRDHTVLGMGYDSAAVAVIYAAGMCLFYAIG